jgi:FeS assembly SUF system protein
MYVYDAPPPPDTEDVIGQAGEPLAPGIPVAAEEDVIAALRNVHDPEIPVNIYDLGLIYELAIAENGDVRIQMTLTAPACPVAGELPQDVANAVNTVEGVGEITVTLTWDPPWTPERMSDVARVALDMF